MSTLRRSPDISSQRLDGPEWRWVQLIEPLGESFRRLYVKSTALRLVATLPTERPEILPPDAKVESIVVTYRGGQLFIDVNTIAPRATTEDFQKRIDVFQQYLTAELKEPVQLQVRVIPVEMLRFKAGPSTAENDATETRNKDDEGNPEPTAIETPD